MTLDNLIESLQKIKSQTPEMGKTKVIIQDDNSGITLEIGDITIETVIFSQAKGFEDCQIIVDPDSFDDPEYFKKLASKQVICIATE